MTMITPSAGLSVILKLTLHVADLRRKLKVSNLNRFSDILGGPQFQNGIRDRDHAHLGGSLAVQSLVEGVDVDVGR